MKEFRNNLKRYNFTMDKIQLLFLYYSPIYF